MKAKRFESVDCKFLQNIGFDNTWICMLDRYKPQSADYCYRCKFYRLRKREEQLSRSKRNG